MIQTAIRKVVSKENLTREEARMAMAQIMEGKATDAQIAALITALRLKGESREEITGFAQTMREKANRLQTTQMQLLDTCGTGGDGGTTFNISTAAAIVAAAGDVRVAKHGNRAVSSKSGSADVLEALGVHIHVDAVQAQHCLDEIGICFMFAPSFHQAMKYAVGPRKEIGIRTVFNILGPLTNPAGADRQIIGVFDRHITEVMAEVLRELGTVRAMVVAGLDGLDEISLSAPTKVTELKEGSIHTYEVTPEQLGCRTYPLEAVAGGDAKENAELIRQIFAGQKGAHRDIVLLNAGASLYLADKTASLREGVQLAGQIIDSGQAAKKLERLIQVTGAFKHVS